MASGDPRQESVQRDWSRIIQEFQIESDRAAPLVAAALMDVNLESLLRSYLVADESEVEIMLGTNLQSLGGRVRATYCLGLISEDEMHDLRLLKEIRNYFAHNLHVSFDDEWVQHTCDAFRLIRRVMPESDEFAPRRLLEQTTCMLSSLLVARERRVRGRRLSKRPEMTRMEISEQCLLEHGGAAEQR
jgi:DNA-binding MltR family transcriptional regulator